MITYIFRKDYNFKYISFLKDGNPNDILKSEGIDIQKNIFSLPKGKNIVAIDDAQKKYYDCNFWELFIKTASHYPENVQFIICATHLLKGQSSTPVHFGSIAARIDGSRLLLNESEALNLLGLHFSIEKYPNLAQLIIKDCNGLVGALCLCAVLLLLKTPVDAFKSKKEEELIQDYYSLRMNNFKRCFGGELMEPNESMKVILQMLLFVHEMETAQEWKGTEWFEQLLNAGVLVESKGKIQFSSPLAARYYIEKLFPDRDMKNPENIREMAEKVTRGMSATQLRQSVAESNNLATF